MLAPASVLPPEWSRIRKVPSLDCVQSNILTRETIILFIDL